jgi:tetratricopeptide (TPR) repeat protein
MVRHLPRGLATTALSLTVFITPACKGDKGEDPQPTAAAEQAGAEGGAEDSAAPAEGGEAVAPSDDAGSEVPPAADEPTTAVDEPPESDEVAALPEESPVPGLFAQAKSLDTGDAEAKQALADAIAAGAARLDAAKVANERGEALMKKGEGERAEEFFRWSADTHKLLAEPIYNLATLAAYAGDLEDAKELLEELGKRGNKRLMRKVGVDPAFALLHDDADVRKIYEVK